MKAHLLRSVAVIVLMLSVVAPTVGAEPPQPPKPGEAVAVATLDGAALAKIEPLLLKQLDQDATTTYLVYMRQRADLRLAQAQPDKLSQRRAVVSSLQATAERSQASVLADLRSRQAAGQVKQMTSFWVFNGLAVTGDRATLLALAAREDVERIQANHVHHLDATAAAAEEVAASLASGEAAAPQSIEWNVIKVRAPEVWNQLGITGSGVVVASMDTGVYSLHPALQATYRGYNNGALDHNYNWYDPTGTYANTPNDGHGHGTHTMGTMVGRDPSGANQVGVAPGAQWVAVKVFDDNGDTTDVALHSGFQWILAPTNLLGQNPDPSKAPDICSNSWGDPTSSDQTFWQDVLAWRAAGIMPVFAGGNAGPNAGTVDSPGSFPQSLAVGATNSLDVIASFSGRGPSPWGEIKPDVSAPGVSVRSSLPPSEDPTMYGSMSGTSMATPHGAAVTALLWQAQPGMTITATEQVLTSTAMPLPSQISSPNNDYGWGRLDAFQAVESAMNGGRFWGRVTDAASGQPVAGAGLIIERQGGVGVVHTTSDAQGYYTTTVGAGMYQVTASNFWYISQTVRNVEISAGFTTILDLAMQRRPGSVLRGLVTSGGAPITATITVAGVPATLAADAGGVYSITLPAGTYDLRVQPATGYRQGSATGVKVELGSETVQDFDLPASPRILLVDADAWSPGASRIAYWQGDLDSILYTFDQWRVMTYTSGLPPAATLQAYDIVVWVQATTSPGYVGAWPALAAFMDGGGRLLISGQDIGYWDDRDSSRTYYRNYLHAQYLRDDAALRSVRGISGDIFAGVTLTLNTTDSASNQTAPDSISALDAQATPVLTYTTDITPGSAAGLKIATASHQAIYLAFGLEGAGSAAARQQVLSTALDWLTLPALTKSVDAQRATPGQALTYTLRLASTGRGQAGDVSITDPLPPSLRYVEGSAGGGLVYNAAQRSLAWQGAIAAQTTLTFTFQALLEPVAGGAAVMNTAYLGNAARVSLPTSAGVLVVAPDLRHSSKSAWPLVVASGQEITYTISLSNTGMGASPVAVVDPIPAGTQYITGSASGGVNYNAVLNRMEWSGVVTATDPLAGTYSVASSDDPQGPTFAWMDISTLGTRVAAADDSVHGPFDIGFPFTFYGRTYTQLWISSNGWLSFIETTSSAFANTCLPSATAPRAMVAPFWDDLDARQGDVYYLSSSDTFVLSYEDVPHFGNTDGYFFQVLLRSDGAITYQYLDMPARLNEATIGLQDETSNRGLSVVCNEEYVHDDLALAFTAHGQAEDPRLLSFRVRVDDNLPIFTTISNAAAASSMGVTTTLTATSTANTVDLATSAKSVSSAAVGPHDTVVYTVTVRNTGNAAAVAFVTDTLPAALIYAPGSAGNGATYDEASRAVHWAGRVSPGASAVVTFGATIAAGLADDTPITNTVQIADPAGHSHLRQAATRYRAADLSFSRKDVTPASARVGEPITYTITVANGGGGPSVFFVTDTLPVGVSYVSGTAQSGHGQFSFDAAHNRFTWSGDLPGENQTFLRFVALVQAGGVITNTVQIGNGNGGLIERSASVVGIGPTVTPTPTVTRTPVSTPTPTATPQPAYHLLLPIIILDEGE